VAIDGKVVVVVMVVVGGGWLMMVWEGVASFQEGDKVEDGGTAKFPGRLNFFFPFTKQKRENLPQTGLCRTQN